MQPKAVPLGFHVHEGGAAPAWSRPVPLLGEVERVGYPLDALPGAIRHAIEEVQDAVQAPVEMVASSALSVASLAAQSLADARRSVTLTGPSSLYFLVVAESGDRKTTVDRLMTRPVLEFQDQQRETCKATVAAHAADLVAWQARRDAVAGKIEGGAKSGKNINGDRDAPAEIEGEKPDVPRVPRLLFEDVTSERLGKALAMEWPSAGIFSSEGGAVLGGHSMGRDAIARTLALLNKLWDGAPHIVDRATSTSFTVRGARMTISLQVQPHVLADFLDRDRGMSRGSGFLARFLVSQPASLQGKRLYKETAATPELGSFSARIREMLSDIPQIEGERGMLLPALDFDPAAKGLWVETYNAIERELLTGGDFASVRDAASKAADNVARLAAVLHCFENGPRGPISLQVVASASRIVMWHLYAARGLFAPFTLSKEAANAATLDRWLIDRCQMEGVAGFPTRTILNAGPNVTRKREDFDKAVKILEDHRRVRLVTAGKRRDLAVNPALLSGSAVDYGDETDIEARPVPQIGWN
jgi:putative DNA primase/helicase